MGVLRRLIQLPQAGPSSLTRVRMRLGRSRRGPVNGGLRLNVTGSTQIAPRCDLTFAAYHVCFRMQPSRRFDHGNDVPGLQSRVAAPGK
jgi:hypothetical protein